MELLFRDCFKRLIHQLKVWNKEKSQIKLGNVPRVFGAVGARCLHLNVLSINSSLSLASEYFSRSSMFWPDVPRNLKPKNRQLKCGGLKFSHLWLKRQLQYRADIFELPEIIKLKAMRVSARSKSVVSWRSRKKASV